MKVIETREYLIEIEKIVTEWKEVLQGTPINTRPEAVVLRGVHELSHKIDLLKDEMKELN